MKTKNILLLTGIFAFGLIAFFLYKNKWSKPKTEWHSAQVIRTRFQLKVQASGAVSPENRFLITPPLAGRIDKLFFTEGQKVKKGQVLALMSSLDRVALLESSQKVPDDIQKMYRPIPLLSPQNGEIVARPVNEGQNVNPQDRIFEISNRLIIETKVDESDIAQIQVGQKADLIVDAFRGQKFLGKVTKVGHQSVVQNNINTYTVIVEPESEIENLKSGMSVSTYFIIRENEKSLVLPAGLAQGKKNSEIIIKTKGANAEFIDKAIQIGESNGEYVEVLSGLNENDYVFFEPLNIEVFKNSFLSNGRSK